MAQHRDAHNPLHLAGEFQQAVTGAFDHPSVRDSAMAGIVDCSQDTGPHTPPPSSASNNLHDQTFANQVMPQQDNGAPQHDDNALHPSHTSLRLQTDLSVSSPVSLGNAASVLNSSSSPERSPTVRPIGIPARTPSLKHVIANSFNSQTNQNSALNSAVSSPMLGALGDVTPLPSPIMSSDSPGPWRKLATRQKSREYVRPGGEDPMYTAYSAEPMSNPSVGQPKRKAYHGLVTNTSDGSQSSSGNSGHVKTRSISEFIPEALHGPKARQHTVSGSYTISERIPESTAESQMRREPNLAAIRGIASATEPPTPPSSRAGVESCDDISLLSRHDDFQQLQPDPRHEYFYAYTKDDEKRRRWRLLKLLGEGTFSKVMLATSEVPLTVNTLDETRSECHGQGSEEAPPSRLRRLVAVKICEHGPKGGASEERVEMSLKRELEIMKTISHPSLIHLIAWNIEETRALLVMSYCPGGDLFEVASQHKQILTPSLLRRIIAELTNAIHFLHEQHIVHRDIKLENVLVNVKQSELERDIDWVSYPYSLISLTDLGLSRRVTLDEKLTTRCGSDDYAAPEVIMGQSYDGRAVDAWSLGVLLYALLEARLPFDPSPGMSEGHKQRSKTSHRIARVEWCWVEYAGEDGDHESDVAKFERCGLRGAMDITEGLLRRARNRWTIDMVKEHDWIRGAIQVDGGIRFQEVNTTEEV